MGLKNWLIRKKLNKVLRKVRSIEINKVDSYMDNVFNPINVISKPKYRNREKDSVSEELTRQYVHMIYDPPIIPSHKLNHTLDEYVIGEV